LAGKEGKSGGAVSYYTERVGKFTGPEGLDPRELWGEIGGAEGHSAELARRLMAGRWTLDPETMVRPHPGQSPAQNIYPGPAESQRPAFLLALALVLVIVIPVWASR
jgi:hypothetical protein